MSVSLYPFQVNAIEKMFTVTFYNTSLVSKQYAETNESEQPVQTWTPCVKEIFFRFFQAHLHMPTGSGKTFIVLGFVQKLISRSAELANYWTLNKENSPYQYHYGTECTYFIKELSSGRYPTCDKREPSGKYMIIVPRSVAFQWKEKAKSYFGETFFNSKIVCIFTGRDLAKVTKHKLVYIVSDQLRYVFWQRIEAKFDMVFCDESHGKLMKKIFNYQPFFVWHMNADQPPQYQSNATLRDLGIVVQFKPVVRTIDEQTLAEFLNLPAVNEQRIEFSISRYLNIIREISDQNDWSFLFYLSIVPQNRVKQVLVDMHAEISHRIEENKHQIKQFINESNAAKRAKLNEFTFFAKLNETNSKKIEELEEMNNQLTERIENINYKLSQIECVICKQDIEEQNQVHFNCCKNMCCLSCIQSMIKSNHMRCPICRENIGPTIESIKRSTMEQTPKPAPASQAADGFLESFRRTFNSLNSDKILVVLAHSENLNEHFFRREFNSLLCITGAARSHFLTNAGGAAGIGNHVTRFRQDPQLRVLYINAKYCFFGLDLEFVDDVIILAENLIPDNIYNQLIGRVQRNGRNKPLTVYKMIGV